MNMNGLPCKPSKTEIEPVRTKSANVIIFKPTHLVLAFLALGNQSFSDNPHSQRSRDTTHGHMITTTILLDRRQTLGAFLGIGTDPVGCLRVIGTLLEP